MSVPRVSSSNEYYQSLHLSDDELIEFASSKLVDTNSRINAMIRHQSDPQRGWKLLCSQIHEYKNKKEQELIVQTIPFKLLFNITRKPSLNAKPLHNGNNEENLCFLCNLNPGQKGLLLLDGKYFATPNPGITVPGDLTILSTEHLPQLLYGSFTDMIELAREMRDFTIFFNGILCGASSPHFHFQAGYKDKLPGIPQIKKMISGLRVGNAYAECLFKQDNSSVYQLKRFLRSTLVVQTDSAEFLDSFYQIFNKVVFTVDKKIKNIANIPDFGCYISSINEYETEGRFNAFLEYSESGEYLAGFFPKITNRPQIYFNPKPSEKITVGMAIKEALGCLITANREDFCRLASSPELIEQLYKDTSITIEMEKELSFLLTRALQGIPE